MSQTSVPGTGGEPRRDAAVGELGLLAAREEARLEAVPAPNLGQELAPVRRVADGARRGRDHALGAELARSGGVAVEHGVHPLHRGVGQAPVGVDPVAEPRDLEQPLDLVQIRVADVGDEEAGRVRAHVHRADTHHRRSLGFSIDH